MQSAILVAMRTAETVVAGAIAVLILAAAANFARGKQDVVIEGVAVQQNRAYEFYPDARDCSAKGTSYLLLPNAGFSEVVRETADVDHVDRLFHSTWRLKIRGDLSRIGRFGIRGQNLREVAVRSVIDARRLECRSASAAHSSN